MARKRSGVYFTCEQCGETFYRYPADIRKGARKGGRMRFCSKACEGAARRNDVQRVCPECGESFTVWGSVEARVNREGRRTFCSATCRDAANGRARRKRVATVCATCGKPLLVIPARMVAGKPNYCSRACVYAQTHTWAQSYGKCGIRADLGHFVRSSWEANVCRALRAAGIAYAYEPRTFRCGDTSYTPDLLVGATWIEVKGYMTPAGARKIAAFRAHYPNEPFLLIGPEEYQAIAREWSDRLPAWE